MSNLVKRTKKHLKYTGKGVQILLYGWMMFVWIMLLFITINVWMLSGHTGTNQRFIFIFGHGGWIATIFAFLFIIPNLIYLGRLRRKTRKPVYSVTDLFFITQPNARFRILSGPILRWAMIVFAVIVAVSFFYSGGSVKGWEVPSPYTTEIMSTGVSGMDKLIHMSITPAFIEDFLVFAKTCVYLSLFYLFFWFLWRIKVTRKFFNIMGHPAIFLLFVVFASVLAATGYGAAIGGFASTHQAVQGQNTQFYIIAIVFGTLNMMIMQLTGIFLPLAHLVNNLMFSFNLAVGLSIGGFVIGQVLLAKDERNIDIRKKIKETVFCRLAKNRYIGGI